MEKEETVLITRAEPLPFKVERIVALGKIPERGKAPYIEVNVAEPEKNNKDILWQLLWILLKASPSLILGIITMDWKRFLTVLTPFVLALITSLTGLGADVHVPITEYIWAPDGFSLGGLVAWALGALGAWLSTSPFDKKQPQKTP